ncbi:hypothetical protein SDC9_128261 [bioreactor metagenome]|uniref:Uncharacterized protein n=1 Tax=bioreactor metagenome TaxID=1076179 RepID=A0A645CWC4_9ZZZZ
MDKTVVFRLLTRKEFHQHRTGNAECLRNQLVHLVAFVLHIRQQLPAGFADRARRNQGHRDNRDADKRHLPVHRKQRDQCRNHHSNIRNRSGQRVGDHCANTADVAFHAGQDIALFLRGVK